MSSAARWDSRAWVRRGGQHIGKLPGVPIVDPADYDKLMAKYAARRRGRPLSDVYLGSGIAMCGRCGARLYGRPRGDSVTYRDGEVKRVYSCMRTHGGCNRLALDQRGLDEHARAARHQALHRNLSRLRPYPDQAPCMVSMALSRVDSPAARRPRGRTVTCWR